MKRFFILSIISFFCLAIQAQTIVNNVSTSWASSPAQGNSFTATLTGVITRIDVRTTNSFNAKLLIYNGQDGSGVSGRGTPAYEQSGVVITGVGSSGWDQIILTTPFPVVVSNKYTYILEYVSGGSTNSYHDGGANTYAGGEYIYNYSTHWINWDMAFRIYESVPPPPVPIAKWAIIIGFGLIVLGISAKYILKRRRANI